MLPLGLLRSIVFVVSNLVCAAHSTRKLQLTSLVWFNGPWLLWTNTFMRSTRRDVAGFQPQKQHGFARSATTCVMLGIVRGEVVIVSAEWNVLIWSCLTGGPQEGYTALTAWSAAKGWKMFKRTPKLHMQQEIGYLRLHICMKKCLVWMLLVHVTGGDLNQLRLWMCDQLQRPGAIMIMSPMCCMAGLVGVFMYLCHAEAAFVTTTKVSPHGWTKTSSGVCASYCMHFFIHVTMHAWQGPRVVQKIYACTCWFTHACVDLDHAWNPKVSRMSRRCHAFLISIRTTRRALMHYRRVWRRHIDD